jgi:RNA polymerase sigma-70 factor, ECF subfamily
LHVFSLIYRGEKLDKGNTTEPVQTIDSKVSFEPYSDIELVREFKNGNEHAFDTLVTRYQSKIYQQAWRMVRNEQDALELSQETFVRAYRALPKFKEKSSFYTWLFRICFNLCLTFLSKSKKEQKVSSIDTMTEERLMFEAVTIKDELKEPVTIKRREGLTIAISNAVEQLPTQQKLVFMMRQYDDMKNKDIANALHLSVGGVKSNYRHAILKLKEMLKEWI